MAKSELERLVSLGLISAWEASKVRRGSKDNSHVDTRDYLSGGRGDDADVGGHDGPADVLTIDQIDAREFQKPKRGAGFDDPRQQSNASVATGQGHIDQRHQAGPNNSWERLRKPDGRWTERIPSVARARASSDSEWNPAWFFGTPETRQK
jgi:hypothetical protein